MVIPVKNGVGLLETQLDALVRQQVATAWEVVVVDNGSTDGTAELAASYTRLLPITVVAEPRRGPNAARNRGVQASSGELLLFTDADDEVAPGWITAMRAAAAHGDLVAGLLDRRIVGADDVWRPTGPDARVSALFRGDFLPYVVGCNLGVWRDVFDDLGGFDEEVCYGGDEVDLTWRALLAGYAVIEAPDAVLHRRERGGVGEVVRQAWRYGAGEAALARRYRCAGYPRFTGGRATRRLVRATLAAPGLAADRAGRRELARRLAFHGGIVAASGTQVLAAGRALLGGRTVDPAVAHPPDGEPG